MIRQAVALGIFVALTFGAAAVGSLATTSNLSGWYAALAKPWWTPPNWIFAPVWTFLYLCMATAARLVWRDAPTQSRRPLAWFAVQLALNAAWSWFFFGYHLPGPAFVELVILLAAIVATTHAFWQHSLAAGILLSPAQRMNPAAATWAANPALGARICDEPGSLAAPASIMLPYLAWSTFAAALNFAFGRLNR